MPKIKMKTHKGLRKRLVVRKKKGRNSYQAKVAGQDHFNARERGKTKRHKRTLRSVDKTYTKGVRHMLPYDSKLV